MMNEKPKPTDSMKERWVTSREKRSKPEKLDQIRRLKIKLNNRG